MQPQRSCFVIKQKVTHTILTINRNTQPTIISFTSEKRAKSFMRMYQSLQDPTLKRQPLQLEKQTISSLSRRCALNSLNLCIMDDKSNYMTFPALDHPTDDIVFHLENTLLYY